MERMELQTDLIAENVDFETYLKLYAEQSAEFVEGMVIKMPVSLRHHEIRTYVLTMLDAYSTLTKETKTLAEPFVMKLFDGRRGREPDVFVILAENLPRLHDTVLDGAADLVVEIVSPESIERDRSEKFMEYQAAGVREYWIIDPVHEECLFYVLDAEGIYKANPPDSQGIYHSRVLSRLKFPAALLLQNPTPSVIEAVNLVQKMLGF